MGAHVSAAGGTWNAPERARRIASVNFQIFTKQPSRWNEPEVSDEEAARFVAARERHEIGIVCSHDSYLINLASPDEKLWKRSAGAFRRELVRCTRLGLDLLVTHPGNATDGDFESGVARNAEGVTRALEAVESPTRILLELTAGTGRALGASFESLGEILDRIPAEVRPRVGVCVDTCHAYSAGYDLVRDYEGVWRRFDDVLGLDRLALFHLNDSKNPFDSRKDRHEHIGEGSLGDEPFRRLMNDERFASVPKLLETPKGDDDDFTLDRKNLERLRSFRRAS